MIKLAGFVFIVLILSVSSLYADPGVPDTVRVDSVGAYLGGKAVVPVYFFNDERLSGLELVLKHDSVLSVLDSVSLAGGRLDYIPATGINARISPSILDLSVVDWQGWIPVGTGLLCKLYFSISTNAGGATIIIDTAFMPPVSHTLFSDSEAYSIEPRFVKGYISVQEPPPTFDSVWVDTVSSPNGRSVALNINAYNGEPVSKIDLALIYSSYSLVYDSIIYNGTRSVTSSSRSVSPDSTHRQLLVTLNFSTTPLPPGSGPLATLIFDIPAGAAEEKVIIDSASYLGITPTQFTTSDGLTFTPYFRSGFVNIKAGTAAEEKNLVVLPQKYSLGQNYPNPFNPSTIIKFDLPRTSEVTLEVFNILGRKVRTLIDRRMSAGSYNVTFDGKGEDKKQLSTGVYFYRLRAEGYEQSRSMMLLK